MFKSIKLRIIKGRQLNPFATAKVLQEHEDRLTALEGEETSSDETTSNDAPQEPISVPEKELESSITRDISITVDDGADAVEGAIVSIGLISGTTGSAGGCTLKDVPDGEQTIEVTADGFGDYEDTITVSESNTSFTISLTAVIPQG